MYKKEDLVVILKDIGKVIDEFDQFIDKASKCGFELRDDSSLWKYYDFTLDTLFKTIILSGVCDKKQVDEAKEMIGWFFFEYRERVKVEDMSIETAEAYDAQNNPICYDFDSLAQYLLDEYLDKKEK